LKHAANIITGSRIVFSAAMLFTDVFSLPFFVLYLLCGITDMIDGTVARKTGSVSKFGEKLDSMADICFVAASALKILPALGLRDNIIIWAVSIAAVRIAGFIIAFFRTGKISLLHTKANKLTGLLLFLFPMCIFIFDADICAVIVCCIATYAAIDECIRNFAKNL